MAERLPEYESTIRVGDRRVPIVGAHQPYIGGLDGSNFDASPVGISTLELPHGVLCLDVGANIGATCVPLAVRRPDLRIMAFEPVPYNAELLRRNIVANGVANIEVIEAAVGDAPGEMRMSFSGPWSQVALTGGAIVPVVNLDSVVSSAPAFIKIDTEGYEPNVFAGAKRLLSEHKPLVLAEFNSLVMIAHHYDPLCVAEFLFSHFDFIRAFENDRPMDIPKYPLELVYLNIIKHGCVADFLMKPTAPMPSAQEIYDPRFADAAILSDRIDALLASTSWRVTAPGRRLSAALSRITT